MFNEVSSLSPIPMVSIVDALAEALKRDGITKVGLLGLASRGARAVALACTELPLLIMDRYIVKLYDTARIHAEKRWS